MKSGRASKTAEHNALFRALDARGPDDVRIVGDRLARELPRRWRFRLVTVPARWRVGYGAVTKIIDRRWPGVRRDRAGAHPADRRDDRRAGGTTPQVVILGAGLDARSWRRRSSPVWPCSRSTTPTRSAASNCCSADTTSTPRHVHFMPNRLQPRAPRRHDDRRRVRPDDHRRVPLRRHDQLPLRAGGRRDLAMVARAAPGSQLIFTYINEDVLADHEPIRRCRTRSRHCDMPTSR